ncbi:unnamed protein product [Sphagnum balticum]
MPASVHGHRPSGRRVLVRFKLLRPTWLVRARFDRHSHLQCEQRVCQRLVGNVPDETTHRGRHGRVCFSGRIREDAKGSLESMGVRAVPTQSSTSEGAAVHILGAQLGTDLPGAFEKSNLKMVGSYAAVVGNGVADRHGHDSIIVEEVVQANGTRSERLSSKGGDIVDRNDNTYGGRWVVNPSGGLEAKGHPIGATGRPGTLQTSNTPDRDNLQAYRNVLNCAAAARNRRQTSSAQLPCGTTAQHRHWRRRLYGHVQDGAHMIKTVNASFRFKLTNAAGQEKEWFVNAKKTPIFVGQSDDDSDEYPSDDEDHSDASDLFDSLQHDLNVDESENDSSDEEFVPKTGHAAPFAEIDEASLPRLELPPSSADLIISDSEKLFDALERESQVTKGNFGLRQIRIYFQNIMLHLLDSMTYAEILRQYVESLGENAPIKVLHILSAYDYPYVSYQQRLAQQRLADDELMIIACESCPAVYHWECTKEGGEPPTVAWQCSICKLHQIGRLIESSSLLLAAMSASPIDMRHGRRRLRATLVRETHRSHADNREADAGHARADRGVFSTRVRRQLANGHSRETADSDRMKDEIEHADSRQQTMVDKLDYYASSTLASTFDQFSEFHEKIDHCAFYESDTFSGRHTTIKSLPSCRCRVTMHYNRRRRPASVRLDAEDQ